MNLLIIGGTRFLGRHIAEYAARCGHTVTLFNRGREAIGLIPDVEHLTGDRYGGLEVLEGRTWDVVIDTCGYEPRAVQASAMKLKDSVGHYIFISSVSVYSDWEKGVLDEYAPVKKLTSEAADEVKEILRTESPTSEPLLKYYGELKAACETQLEEIIPGRVLHVRSGIIVGPYDYSGRFPYWVNRISQGGRVLCPDRPEAPIRFLDVRDLADWIVYCAEEKTAGVFNTWGRNEMTFGQFLTACELLDRDPVELVWFPEEKLLANDVQPWSDLPLWLPSSFRPYFNAKDDRANRHGLRYRSIEQTTGDTRDWLDAYRPEFKGPEGLSPEREAELLMRFE